MKDPEALLACIDRTLNGRRRSAHPDPRERSCACGTPIAVDHRSQSRAKNEYDVSLLIFFYTHMRGDWTARLVCGCNYWPRDTIPFPNCSLCDRDAHPQPRLLKYARIELAVPDMIGSGVLDNARLKSKRRRHD